MDIIHFVYRVSLLYFCDCAEKFLKSQLLYFLPYRCDRANLPPSAKVSFGPQHRLGTGLLTILSHRLLNGKGHDWFVCSYDLCGGVKKGLPSPSDRFCRAQIESHKAICVAREPVELIMDEFTERVNGIEIGLDLKGEVERTVNEVFRHGRSVDFLIPSSSAHFTHSRKEGGAYNALDFLTTQGIPEFEEIFVEKQLSADPWETVDLEPVRLVLPSMKTVSATAQQFYTDCWNEAVKEAEEKLMVKPIGLPEPLKCRVITLGPAFPYYISLYIQKLVHGTLRQHVTFTLTGEPCTEEIINSRFGALTDMSYISGDYEAATDNLNPELSVFAAECIGARLGLGSVATDLFKKALVNHRIVYPDGFVGDQQWGQLMGSPVSFPILCIINAAATRCAMEIAEQRRTGSDRRPRYRLEQLPLLINGDDVVFTEYAADIDIWNRIVTRVGLKPSVGKNYVTKQFLLVNSQLYIPRRDRDVQWEYVPFINFGLLKPPFGVTPGVTSLTGSLECKSVGQMSHDLCRGFSPLMCSRLMKVFETNWLRTLELADERQNWYIPHQLGGLGLFHSKDVGEFTLEQRMLATYLASADTPDAMSWYTLPKCSIENKPSYLQRAEKLYLKVIKDNAISLRWADDGEDVQDPLFTYCIKTSYLFGKGNNSPVKGRTDTGSLSQYRSQMKNLWNITGSMVRRFECAIRSNWIDFSEMDHISKPMSTEKILQFNRKATLTTSVRLPGLIGVY